jgi:hypothetical protein
VLVQPLRSDDPHRLGRYRVLGRLGEGGMGAVFKGESPGGRQVAIKLVHPHLVDRDPAFRSRFRKEIAAAQRVGGFWTAAVVDGDADAPSPWYASAFIDAPTLHDVVRASGPLDPEAVMQLGRALAEALDAIHAAGIVHRDLKPTNILMAPDGPRVIDFGIVRIDLASGEHTLTPTGMIVGTPGYLSPEQLDGGVAAAASDVFALGSLLYFAATGTIPFAAATEAAVMVRTLTSPPDLSPLPAQLQPVIGRCLGKRPAERPSVAALAGMLAAPAEGESGRRPAPPRPAVEPAPRPDRAARARATNTLPPAHRRGDQPHDTARVPDPPRAVEQRSGPRTAQRWVGPGLARVVISGALIGTIVGAMAAVSFGGVAVAVVVGVLVAAIATAFLERSVRKLGAAPHGGAGFGWVGIGSVLAFGSGAFAAVRLSELAWWWCGLIGLGAAVLHFLLAATIAAAAESISAPSSMVGAAWGTLSGLAVAVMGVVPLHLSPFVAVSGGIGVSLVVGLVLAGLLNVRVVTGTG